MLARQILKSAVAATLVVALPIAQGAAPGTARIEGLRGNVLMSQDSGLAAAVEGAWVTDGSRVIAMHGANVSLVYNDDCQVPLGQNQRVEVKSDVPCAQRIALTESMLPNQELQAQVIADAEGAGAGTVGGAGSGSLAALAGGAGLIGGLAVLQSNRASRNVSPS